MITNLSQEKLEQKIDGIKEVQHWPEFVDVLKGKSLVEQIEDFYSSDDNQDEDPSGLITILENIEGEKIPRNYLSRLTVRRGGHKSKMALRKKAKIVLGSLAAGTLIGLFAPELLNLTNLKDPVYYLFPGMKGVGGWMGRVFYTELGAVVSLYTSLKYVQKSKRLNDARRNPAIKAYERLKEVAGKVDKFVNEYRVLNTICQQTNISDVIKK